MGAAPEAERRPGAILSEIFDGDMALHRLLLETSIDPVSIVDGNDARFVFVTPGYARLVGRPVEELLGSYAVDLVHPDDLDRVRSELHTSVEAGETQIARLRLLRGDGTYVHVEAAVRTFVARDGRTLVIASNRDLTERELVESELRATEERYLSLIEGIEAVVWEADPASLAYTFVSRRAVDLLGYPLEDWHRPGFWQAHLHPDDRERALAAQTLAIDAGEDHELLYRMRSASGADVWLRDLIRLVPIDGSERVLLRGVSFDVTAQVEAQAERDRLEGELQHVQKLEAIGRLAGGIAHDFNNLLTAIHSYAELALTKPAADSVREELEQIRLAADRAAGLTRQLLAFGRRQDRAPELIDLNAVILEMQAMLQRLIGTHVEFVFALEPKLERTLADPSQLQQIVLNLTINARDAMPEGGRLELRTENLERDERRFVAFSVCDTGVGIDEVTRERLFEPFFTTKPMGEGTGLGLATVHGIVGQSGGEVEVDSEVGRGTTFRVLLPAAEPVG